MLESALLITERLPASEDLVAGTVLADSILFRVGVVGEAAKQVSSAVRALGPDVPWRPVARLRDVVIHQYRRLDYTQLTSALRNAVPELARNLRELVRATAGGVS